VQYYDIIRIEKHKDKDVLMLGAGILIILPDSTLSSSIKNNLKITAKGTISERIRDLEFLLAICAPGKHEFACGSWVSDVDLNLSDEKHTKLLQTLDALKTAKSALEHFGVTEELELDNLTSEDHEYLNTLIAASKGESVSLIADYDNYMGDLQIANLKVAVIGFVAEDGNVKLKNLFDELHRNCIIVLDEDCTELNFDLVPDDKKYESSFCLRLTRQNLLELSNINYDAMYNSIISVVQSDLYLSIVNVFLLDAILVYDKKPSDPLLEFCEKLSAWLVEQDDTYSGQLNCLQVAKRHRPLTYAELAQLRQIANTSDYEMVKVAAFILLDSFTEARATWDAIAIAERANTENYSHFPIWNLWTINKPDELCGIIT